LSGLDASFLYTESPTVHMHTLKIGVIDPSGTPGGYSFERFCEVLEERLALLPPFRRRPVPVPFGLVHPVWIEDPDFDLRRHVRQVTAAAPGGGRELDDCISEVASTPLPRDRPLWEICVVEGLEGARLGFVAKLHHAMADGVAAAQLLTNVMAISAEASLEPVEPGSWRPEPVPSRGQLLAGALRDIGRLALRFPVLLVRTLGRLGGVLRTRREAEHVPPAAFQGPATSFNGRLTARRRFASTALALEDFRRVKAAFAVTVNDVVLSVVAGSLRRYLLERGEPVDRPLVAAVPVSSDQPDTVRLMGNRTSNLFTALRVDEPDPVERVRATSRVTSTAKDLQNALGVETMEEWVEFSPPAAYRLIWRAVVPRVRRPPINAIVSNVPGPREPLYAAGAELVELLSVGPLLEGVGLNVTVWSYRDSMFVGVLCCPDRLADPHAITDGIEAELGGLLDRARLAEA